MKRLVKVNVPVKDLLFRKFKKAYGLKVFLLKYNNEREKDIYGRVLSVLREKNYLNYVMNSNNIQIFLSDRGRTTVDEQTQWEIEELDESDESKKPKGKK